MKKDIKEIVASIEENIKKVFTTERYKEYLEAMSKFYRYSAQNIQFILMQNPDVSNVNSLKRWNELGRKVKKGEKALKILFPYFFKYIIVEKEIVPYKDLSKKQKQKVKNGELKLNKILRFKLGNVFDISQTVGAELPSLVDKVKGNSSYYIKIMQLLISKVDIPVKFEILKSAGGYFSPLENVIVINNTNDKNHQLKTLVHEIAHYKTHEALKGKANYSDGEIIAESVAFTVCNYLGLDTGNYSFGYIAHWSEDRDIKQFKNHLKIIQNTAKEIIESIENDLDSIIEKSA